MNCKILKIGQNENIDKRQIRRKYFGMIFFHYLKFFVVSLSKNYFNNMLEASLKDDKCFHIFFVLIKLRFKKNLIIQINPSHLKYTLKDWVKIDNTEIVNTNHYFIGSGDWKNILFEIEKTPVFRELNELIKCDFDYKNTKLYARYVENIQNNIPSKKQHRVLDSKEAINSYFKKFIDLYDSIKTRGFLPAHHFVDFKNKEIGIAILQDGTIVKMIGAQHRVAIAKVLKIQSIPVEIRMIHKDYLNVICAKYSLNYSDAILKIIELTKIGFYHAK